MPKHKRRPPDDEGDGGGGGDKDKKNKKDKKDKKDKKKKKKRRKRGGDPDGGDGSDSSDSSSDSSSSTEASRSRTRRKGAGRTEKVEIPKWPKAFGLEQWFERVCRIISGAARDYEAAYQWILRVCSKEDTLEEELKNSGPKFGHIDQMIAADMLKKCQEYKNNSKADEIHRDIATAITLDNQKAHSSVPARMMRGREMIRILMHHLSVRKEYGQHVTVSDLQRITLQPDKDKNLKKFHQNWEHYYSRFQQDCQDLVPSLRDLIHDHYWKQVKDVPCLKHYFLDYLRTPNKMGVEPNAQEYLRKQVVLYLDRKRHDAQTESFRLNIGSEYREAAPAKGAKGKGKSKGSKGEGKGKGKASTGGKGKGKGKSDGGSKGGKGKGKSKGSKSNSAPVESGQDYRPKRSGTPPPEPVVPVTRGGKYNPKNKCFASSLGRCPFAHDPSKCKFTHAKLTPEERTFRDQWIEMQKKNNKPIPWEVGREAPAQAHAAPSPRSESGKSNAAAKKAAAKPKKSSE